MARDQRPPTRLIPNVAWGMAPTDQPMQSLAFTYDLRHRGQDLQPISLQQYGITVTLEVNGDLVVRHPDASEVRIRRQNQKRNDKGWISVDIRPPSRQDPA